MYIPVAYRLAGDVACPECVRQGRKTGTVLRPPPPPGRPPMCARLDNNGIPTDAMDTFGNPIRPLFDRLDCQTPTCQLCGSQLANLMWSDS